MSARWLSRHLSLSIFALSLLLSAPAVATNGICGSANGTSSLTMPTSNLCSMGTVSSVAGTGPWSWTCSGSGGGTTASCSVKLIVNGACGTANGTIQPRMPITGLCGKGTATTITTVTNTANNVIQTFAPLNGCVTHNPTYTTAQCDRNYALDTLWQWSCNGANTGTNATCSATSTTLTIGDAVGVGSTATIPFGYGGGSIYGNPPSYTGYNNPGSTGGVNAYSAGFGTVPSGTSGVSYITNNGNTYYEGTNYSNSMTVNTTTFPNGTTFNWSWPTLTAIKSFPSIGFGNYDNGTVQSPTGVTPAQVSSIAALTETHSLALSGSTTGFDLIDDVFLTSTAGNQTSTNAAPRLYEIEIFLHTNSGAVSYFNTGTQEGNITISGTTWKVAETTVNESSSNGGTWTDILVMPTDQADRTNAAIDIKAMLNQLVTMGLITGNPYFNGFAMGAEPVSGAATMKINSFNVSYTP